MTQFLTLHHYWRSSSSWRVRWALELKKIKPKFIHISLLNGETESPEYLKVNPLGFVPVLQVDDIFMTESVAIIEWLEETVPSPKLLPANPFLRAHIRSLVEIINAGIQPVQNTLVLDKIGTDEVKRKEWAQFFIRKGLKAYEERCLKLAGEFSVGEEITLADLFLVPQIYNAKRFEVDLREFPILDKINERALKTEAAKASHPDNYKV